MEAQPVIISDHASNIQIIKDFISNLISSLTGKMFSFGLGLMLLNQTGSPISFGLSMIIDPIVSMLFVIPIGNLIDTYHHKNILMTSLAARIVALLIFLLTINHFVGHYKLIPVIIFLIIVSISVSVNNSGYSASVHELVNEKKISRLNSLSQSATALSLIVSPALGVGLYSFLGFQAFIMVSLISNLVSLLILFTMKFYPQDKETTEEDQSATSAIAKFKSAVHYINQLKVIKYTILIAVVFNFVYTSLTVGMPYIIKEQFGFSNSIIGILETATAFGFLAGSVLTNFLPPKMSYQFKLLVPLVIADVFFVLLGILFSFNPGRVSLSILGSIIMFGFSLVLVILNIIIQTFLQEKVKSGMLGRVISVMYTSCSVASPVGVVVYTVLFKHVYNGGLVLLASGIFLAFYSIVFIPTLVKKLSNI